MQALSTDSGPHPPFVLDSSCVLSEDHFLVKVGQIDPTKDKVVAYTRPDGQVEAVLLQNQVISLVYRDPTTAGGWNIHEIAAGATDMVAGMASDKSTNLHLHVFYKTTSGQVRHLLQGPPSSDGTSSTQFTPVDTLELDRERPAADHHRCDAQPARVLVPAVLGTGQDRCPYGLLLDGERIPFLRFVHRNDDRF